MSTLSRKDKGGESPQVLHLMQTLGISQEEAEDIIECDKRIDRGENLFELSQDQKQVVRQMAQTRSVDAYGKTRTRERKADEDKGEIIKVIAETLAERLPTSSVEVVNSEREISFCLRNRKFKIVLSAPRK